MSENNTYLFEIRRGKQTDANFILNSWLKSYRHSPLTKSIRGDIYYKHHHDKIIKLLSRSKIACAVSKDEDSQIYGWACFEEGVLHYIYTKHSYRGFGIATEILKSLNGPYEFSHAPMRASNLFIDGTFNPYRSET